MSEFCKAAAACESYCKANSIVGYPKISNLVPKLEVLNQTGLRAENQKELKNQEEGFQLPRLHGQPKKQGHL